MQGRLINNYNFSEQMCVVRLARYNTLYLPNYVYKKTKDKSDR